MKKLMIVAAAAVAAGAAFAEAQVLEWNLTLKTTTCKEGKASGFWLSDYNDELEFEKGDEVSYRTSASVKLTGLTWGCFCDTTLNGRWFERFITINSKGDQKTGWDGITFWNPKTDAFLGGVYNGSQFDWGDGFVNRIGKKCDEVELCFGLVPSDEATEDNWFFVLAGFGKVKNIYNSREENWCDSYLASASGNVTGYMSPDEGVFNCTYCDQWDVVCNVYSFCAECDDPQFDMDKSKTVAFGTWKMKYNSAASKKLRTQHLITKSYSFKKGNVKDELVAAGE